MLEVKNLSKIYKATVKNGVETKALDNVSLTFPNKGMVFLLGKSGSGKSTLLNVCGGLDAPTSGEIIVKGKSSKNFSQSDFDSYRNTFVGFIFQEYNILNEFSVEDNIALALELQGKPKDKKVIAELLEQVDLSGFAKRKPNTLSGGQKQRIAIARALVKSPEIIMADEPTGALDSNTGKQVFDTLKKLSADKLVIVVSHDRDFAELYGDRIIELKDGKILSDVTKTEQEQTQLTDSISAIDGVLCIKQGASLTDKDFDKIKSFLESSSSDVIIAKDEQDIAAFKKAAHITESGSKEVFADTDESKLDIKQYTPADSKFIRSRLPLRHATKIGVSSLKTKPIRLIFTIILCTVAFILFGLLSTLTFYNSEAMFKQTLSDTQRDYVTLENKYLLTVKDYENGTVYNEYELSAPANFSASDMKNLSSIFGNDIFGATYSQGMEYNVRSRTSNYWNNEISTIAYLPEDNIIRNKINGKYPEKDNEICISQYSAEMLIESQAINRDGKNIDASTPNELIGKTILVSGEEYKIVGIFDCGNLDPKFEDLKNATESNYSLITEFEATLSDGMYLLAFFSKDTFDDLASQFTRYAFRYENDTRSFGNIILPTANRSYSEYPDYRYSNVSNAHSSNIKYFDSQKTTINDNEILISQSIWTSALYSLLDYKYNNSQNLTEEEYQYVESLRMDIESLVRGEKYEKYIDDEYIDGDIEENTEEDIKTEPVSLPLSQKERDEIIARLINEFSDTPLTFELTLSDSDYLKIGEPTTYKIVGMVNDEEYNTVYVTNEEYNNLWNTQFTALDYCTVTETNYVSDGSTNYSLVYAPFNNTDSQKNLLWDIHSNKQFNENSTKVSVSGTYISELDMINELVESLSQVFLYVGLVFAIFAILLFSNFISTSISQKRREIGILRAVGARGTDVFKIFFSESFVIAFICSIISIFGTTSICSALNLSISEIIGASIFVFGPFSMLIIVGTALLTAILATFVPVWLAARKKPVESIKAL